MSRLGRHRIRPSRSIATLAKPEIRRLGIQIAEARRRGDTAGAEKLARERAWLIANTLF